MKLRFLLVLIVLSIIAIGFGSSFSERDFLTPLQQIKTGISPNEVTCKQGFDLIIKKNYNSPACVRPSTAEKLILRGWGIPTDTASMVEIEPSNIVDSTNRFARDFYSQVTKDNEENVFFSPLSISNAFAIAYEGAKGNTADEIRQVFDFPKNDENRRSSFLAMNNELNEKDPKYKLHIANALWIAEGFEPLSEYVDIAKTYYNSEVSNVDFVSDKGVNIINDWVKLKTEGKIKQIFPPGSTDENTRLAITNAIYFKGTWVTQFNENKTLDRDFMVNSEKVVKVPMMYLPETTFNYSSNDQLQILEMPYEGDKLSMLILLPNEIDGLKSLENSLNTEALSQWRNTLSQKSVIVQIPKFKLETNYGLIPILQDLGMQSAFIPDVADFSGITKLEKLFITAGIHKAFVDVNEEGTEAVAATGIIVGTTSAKQPPPEFIADHPFIFLIQENDTGNILFMGRIVNPSD